MVQFIKKTQKALAGFIIVSVFLLSFVSRVYAQSAAPQTAATAAVTQHNSNSMGNIAVYVSLSFLVLVIAFALYQLNAGLGRIARKREGRPVIDAIPWFRSKKIIALVSILIFIFIGYWVTTKAIGLGRTQNYEPKQPIFYSHRVHAGINQINCLYCHTNAQYSRSATVPPVNVCMNCHMAISTYTGPQLYDADSLAVDGTAEIKKLYKYAGFTPGPGAVFDASKATEIPWIRIHSLPNHVYFNHSQHVMVGKVQCQTCHGDVTTMDEMKQFAPLSMSWCINCHRTTAVQFKDNGFYDMYTKYHDSLKNGKIDSVTVEMVGGTECQRCHY
jgi:hypothetical protein